MLCDACMAAKTASEPAQAQAPVSLESQLYQSAPQPAQESAPQPVFELNDPVTTAQKAPKPPRAKGFPLGTVIAAILVVAIAVSAVVCWDSVQSFFVRSFGTPEEYLERVEEKAAEEVIDSVSSAYGDILGAFDTADTDTALSAQISISVGDDLLDLLSTYLNAYGMNMDVSWLGDICLTMDEATDGDLFRTSIGIGLGNTTIATYDFIMDLAMGTVYYGFPELSDAYLCLDPEDMGMDMDDYQEIMDQYSQILVDVLDDLPSEKRVNELLSKYWQIVLEHMQDTEKDTETVEVGGIAQKLNVITCTLTQEDLLNIFIEILEDIRDDDELIDCITGIWEQVYQGNGYYDWVYNSATGEYEMVFVSDELDYEEELLDAIDETLEELEDALDRCDEDNRINITTYVDNSDEIVGRTFEIESADGEDQEISWVTVWKGKEYAFEADILGQVKITGSGTRSGDLINGEYKVKYQRQTVLEIEVIDYDEKKADEGYLSGSFKFVPGDDLLEEILDDMGVSSLGGVIKLTDLGIQIDISESADGTSMGIRVVQGRSTLVGLTVSTETGSDISVKVPGNTVGVDEAMEWIVSFDFDTLLSNMRKAGVDEELVDMLEDGIDEILYWYG